MSEIETDGPLTEDDNLATDAADSERTDNLYETTAEQLLTEEFPPFPPNLKTGPGNKAAPQYQELAMRYADARKFIEELMEDAAGKDAKLSKLSELQEALATAEATTAETIKSYHVAMKLNEQLSADQTAHKAETDNLKRQLEVAIGERNEFDQGRNLATNMVHVASILSYMSDVDPFRLQPISAGVIVVENKKVAFKLSYKNGGYFLYFRYLGPNGTSIGEWRYFNQVIGKLTANDMLALSRILNAPIARIPSEAAEFLEPDSGESYRRRIEQFMGAVAVSKVLSKGPGSTGSFDQPSSGHRNTKE